MSNSKDNLYTDRQDYIVDFEFNEQVAHVFSDMLRRSVPAYASLVTNSGLLAAQYAQDNSFCYDLGCSLGAISVAMGTQIKTQNTSIIAVDNSEAMLRRCKDNVQTLSGVCSVQCVCADIQDIRFQSASVIVLNLTLQFLAPSKRLGLLTKIYQALNPGGALIVTEKVLGEDAQDTKLYESMHRAFKGANGYTELQISQKRNALENVLIPQTVSQHCNNLSDAGFTHIHQWFQCFNFVSLLAVK